MKNSIVKFAGHDKNFVACRFVDKAMLETYPARPISRKFVFERFGLSDAGKRASANVLYDLVDFCEDLFVARPFLIVRECLFGKRNFHNDSMGTERTAPDLICEMERSRCSRFACVERRYSVSSAASRTEISMFRPANIVFSESKKFELSSSQFNKNVLCIKTSFAEKGCSRKRGKNQFPTKKYSQIAKPTTGASELMK